MDKYSVLIADDDIYVRKILTRICQKLQWSSDEVASGQETIEKINSGSYQIYVLDVKMPRPSGVELAKIILEKDPTAAVLILTGFAEVEHAVGAIKKGVFDYIQKENVENEDLMRILHRAAEFHDNRKLHIQAQEEREQALRDIEKSNKEFQSILELSCDLIFIVNAKTGEFTDCNKAACSRLGYNRLELLSLSLCDVITDFQYIEWDQTIQSICKQAGKAIEKEVLTKTKQIFPVDLTCAYVCLNTGEYLAIIARDITDRKRAEREIETQRKKVENQATILQMIIESLDEGILLADSNGVITEVNSWFINLTRTPKEFLIQQSAGKILRQVTQFDIENVFNDYKSRVNTKKVCQYFDFNDQRFLITTQPIFKQEEYQGVIIHLVDISNLVSDQKRAEIELQNNRNNLVDVTKDLQTPLDGIIAIASQLSETPLDESQQLLVKMIQEFSYSLSQLLKGCAAGVTKNIQ